MRIRRNVYKFTFDSAWRSKGSAEISGAGSFAGLREAQSVPFSISAEETSVYAIIQSRGRQLRVSPGAVVEVDGLLGESGSEMTLEQVLLVEKDSGEVLAGAPFVANARIVGVVEGESRGPKLRVFKKKRRKGFRKTRGHRSIFTRVRITDIQV